MRSFVCGLLTVLLSCVGLPAMGNLVEGLVVHYPFDGDAVDASGNGLHGVIVGAVPAADRKGNTDSAYAFDGVDDRVVVPDDAKLNLVTGITITAWVKILGSTGDHQVILGKYYRDGWTLRSYILELQPDGRTLQLAIPGVTGDTSSSGASSVPLDFNEWTHVAATYDGHTARVYLNGEETGSHAQAGTIPVEGSRVLVGAHDTPADRNPLLGSVDEVRLYDRALSAEEIRQLGEGVVAFARFVPASTYISYHRREGRDRLFAAGLLKLGPESDGIDPLAEDVLFEIGSFRLEIPPGEFKLRGSKRYCYSGMIGETVVWFMLKELRQGGYGYRVHVKDCDLSGTANPTTLGLSVGNDEGWGVSRMSGVLRSSRRPRRRR